MRLVRPEADFLVAEHPDTHGKLYAWLQPRDPFYATAKFILPGKRLVGRQRTYWLAWDIEGQRLTKMRDAARLVPELYEWTESALAVASPGMESVHGVTVAEVEELRAERAAARAAWLAKNGRA
jgi:hypothetical protein